MSDSLIFPRSRNLRVVKLGGSLLIRERLVHEVHDWLEAHPVSDTLMVVGGGAMVDAVRELDASRPLSSADVHWLCVDLLHISFQICRGWFPRFESLEDPNQLRTWLASADQLVRPGKQRIALVSPRAFYRRNDHQEGLPKEKIGGLESSANPLPLDWRTTTDSIAAWLAKSVQADQLVIWKSCVIPKKDSIADLVASGVLDEAFMDVSTGDSIFPTEKTCVVQLHSSAD